MIHLIINNFVLACCNFEFKSAFVIIDLKFISIQQGEAMKYQLKLLGVLLFLLVDSAFAVGTFIPAANRVDMAHDFKRNLIYISN